MKAYVVIEEFKDEEGGVEIVCTTTDKERAIERLKERYIEQVKRLEPEYEEVSATIELEDVYRIGFLIECGDEDAFDWDFIIRGSILESELE